MKKKLTLAYRRLEEIRELEDKLEEKEMYSNDNYKRLSKIEENVDELLLRFGFLTAPKRSGSTALVGHTETTHSPFTSIKQAREWVQENLML